MAAALTQDSKAQVNLIQSIVRHIRGLLGDGELEEAEEELTTLTDKLIALKEGVEGVPGAVRADAMVGAIGTTVDELNRMAAEKGIEGLIPPVEFGEGVVVKAEDMIEIRNGVSELKSIMIEIRSLLDQEINKPIVHGWLEGE